MARHFYRNTFSIFLVSFVLVISCLGQEYEITAKFPIVVFKVNFSDTSSPEYKELQEFVKDGLAQVSGLNVSDDFTLRLEQDKTKSVEFHVSEEPESVAEGLYKLITQELIIDDQITHLTSLTCTGGARELQYPTQMFIHECDIRQLLSPCDANQDCHREKGDKWLTCVDRPTVTTAASVTRTPVEKDKLDKDLVIVLGYGAAFFALMLVFLVVYCWRKGCANRRKQRELEAMGDAVYRPEDMTIM